MPHLVPHGAPKQYVLPGEHIRLDRVPCVPNRGAMDNLRMSLRDALAAWVADVVAAFVKQPRDCVLVGPGHHDHWKQERPGEWVLHKTRIPLWHPRFIREMQSPERLRAIEHAARSDDVVSGQIGMLLGTSSSSRRLDAASLTSAVLPQLAFVGGKPRVADHPTFNERWDQVRTFLQAETIEQVVFWPLAGIVLLDGPIVLAPHLELDAASEDEMGLALTFGIVQRDQADLQVAAVDASSQNCLRYRFSDQKIVSRAERKDTSKKALADLEAQTQIADHFELALSRSQSGNFAVLARIHAESFAPFNGRAVHINLWRDERQAVAPPVRVGPREATALKHDWERIHPEPSVLTDLSRD